MCRPPPCGLCKKEAGGEGVSESALLIRSRLHATGQGPKPSASNRRPNGAGPVCPIARGPRMSFHAKNLLIAAIRATRAPNMSRKCRPISLRLPGGGERRLGGEDAPEKGDGSRARLTTGRTKPSLPLRASPWRAWADMRDGEGSRLLFQAKSLLIAAIRGGSRRCWNARCAATFCRFLTDIELGQRGASRARWHRVDRGAQTRS